MIIPARFNGPPGSGNGGYSAGLFAGGARCEVTPRVPPPLDTHYPCGRTGPRAGQHRRGRGLADRDGGHRGTSDRVRRGGRGLGGLRRFHRPPVPLLLGAGRPYVLGRIAVTLDRMPRPGDQCVVLGALASAQGRKALVHTTLYGPDGTELARARATWIAVGN
jgi:hypothetical protein